MKNEKIGATSIFKLLALTLFIAGLLTTSCYKDYGMETKDYDIVAAFYDKEADFSAYKTYFMPDTVLHIVKEGEEDNITRKFDRQMLDQVDVNMETLGYQKIETPSEDVKPDLFMVILATTTEHSYIWYDYPWYPGYPIYPGYPGYPGWWYPWYPVWGTSSYSTGTVVIAMVDAEQSDPDKEKYKAVWSGAINGLLGDSEANIRHRLTSAINEAFTLSPYLGAE